MHVAVTKILVPVEAFTSACRKTICWADFEVWLNVQQQNGHAVVMLDGVCVYYMEHFFIHDVLHGVESVP